MSGLVIRRHAENQCPSAQANARRRFLSGAGTTLGWATRGPAPTGAKADKDSCPLGLQAWSR
jgi:hypothetical protein